MEKFKFVTNITVLAMVAVASAFVAVGGVIYAFDSLLQGDRMIDIVGPIAMTVMFSHLCADSILRSVSKIEKFNKNGK